MDLRFALLLFGIVVVVVVALSALDRARVSRSSPRRKLQDEISAATTIEISSRFAATPAAFIDDSEKFIKSDAEVVLPEKTEQDVLLKEIKNLEQVATMPLNLAPSLSRVARRRLDPGRQFMSDPAIDFVINLPGEGPVVRNKALGVFKQHEYNLSKPRHLYGMRHQTNQWSDLQLDSSSTEYGDITLAIQLVDLQGPIDESELNIFTQLGLQLADALARPTQLPVSFEEGLIRARQLQKFCETYDVVAGVNVISSNDTPFSGYAINVAAKKLGLELNKNNIFHLKNDVSPGSPHFFCLANLNAPNEFNLENWETFETSGLALFMSVPCAFQPDVAFEKMVTTANALCEMLGGRLEDQDRRPLSEKGLAIIRHQIDEMEEKMRAFGVAPGSETALKLFNEAAKP